LSLLYPLSYNPQHVGGTHFINDKGIIEATSEISGSDTILRWDIGDYRYQFRRPTSEEWKIQSIILRNTGNARVTWGYTNGNLTTIDFADTASDISLNWDTTPTPNRLVKINYPGNVKEEFKYNSGVFYGVEQTIGATPTPIARIQFTEDNDNRPLAIKGYSMSGAWPGTFQTQNDYQYKSSTDDRLSTYERFGNAYTVTDTDTTHTVTNPDESYVQETTSGDSTTTTVTTAIVGNDDDPLSTTIVERNRTHDVATEITDGEGNSTTYLYRYQVDPNAAPDDLDLLERITTDMGHYTQYTYDSESRVERVSQKTNGNSELAYVQYEYNDEDRITRTHTGGLNDSVRDYEGDDLHSITDGEGREMIFEYDADGRLESVGDGTYNTTFDYDSLGRRELTTSPLGIETKYEYHTSTGNLSKVYNDYKGGAQLLYKTEYKYDRNGYGNNLAEVLDAEGRKTTYEYDVWDRLQYEKVWDGVNLAGTIEYEYDSGMGEYFQKKTDMFGHETVYDYFAPGFLKTQTWNRYDPQSQTTDEWGSVDYTYDDAGRVETVVSTDGDCGSCNSTKNYVYNGNGQLSSHTANQAGTISYGYDGVGRLNSVDIPNEGGTAGLNTVSYTYDAANRLDTVASGIISTFDMSYNLADQVELIDFVNTDIVYDYDTENARLKQIWVNYPSGTDRTIDYGYNSDGLRTSAKLDNNRTIAYLYDGLNRLVQESGHKETVGNCVTLDGTGDFLEPASGGDLGASMTAITIEAKVYLNQYSSCTVFKRGVFLLI